MRDFKKKNPDLDAPDFIKISTSNLAIYYELTVLIGLIEGVVPNEEAVVIWLVANYDTNEAIFFLDEGLIRKFSRKGQSVKVNAKDKPKKVVIRPRNSNIPDQTLWLKIPEKEGTKLIKSKEHQKLINKFSIGVHAGVGIEKLTYSYQNLDLGFPTWYTINFSEKNIGATFSYNLKRFRFGLNTTYQNVFSYTSYLNVRFDNPREVIDPTTGRRRIIENIGVETNQDEHPKNRFKYGGTIGFRLHPTQNVVIEPFISYGQIRYSGGYIGNRFEDGNNFKMKSNNYQDIGMQFEFVSGRFQAVYLNFLYQQTNWKPIGFFETIPHNDLVVKDSVWRFTFGYRIGL